MEAINDRRTIWWGLCKRQMDLRSWPLEDVVAVARKLATIMAAMLRDGTCWQAAHGSKMMLATLANKRD